MRTPRSSPLGGWLAAVQATNTTRCTAVGALFLLLALAGQSALVYRCYQGNWTGLFLTGDHREVPPQLAAENIYLFEGSTGYDGQYYHYIAHDPFRQRGLSEWVDVPGTRDEERGHVTGVRFENIQARADPPRIELKGFDATHAVENVVFHNVVVNGQPLTALQVKTNEFVRALTVRP